MTYPDLCATESFCSVTKIVSCTIKQLLHQYHRIPAHAVLKGNLEACSPWISHSASILWFCCNNWWISCHSLIAWLKFLHGQRGTYLEHFLRLQFPFLTSFCQSERRAQFKNSLFAHTYYYLRSTRTHKNIFRNLTFNFTGTSFLKTIGKFRPLLNQVNHASI